MVKWTSKSSYFISAIIFIVLHIGYSHPDIYRVRPKDGGKRVIQPYSCRDPATKEEGVCMFSWNSTPPAISSNEVTETEDVQKLKLRPSTHRTTTESILERWPSQSTTQQKRIPSSTRRPVKVSTTEFPPGLYTWRPNGGTRSTAAPNKVQPTKLFSTKPLFASSTTDGKATERPYSSSISDSTTIAKFTSSSNTSYEAEMTSTKRPYTSVTSVSRRRTRPTRPNGSIYSKRKTRPTRPYSSRNSTRPNVPQRKTKPTRPVHRLTTVLLNTDREPLTTRPSIGTWSNILDVTTRPFSLRKTTPASLTTKTTPVTKKKDYNSCSFNKDINLYSKKCFFDQYYTKTHSKNNHQKANQTHTSSDYFINIISSSEDNTSSDNEEKTSHYNESYSKTHRSTTTIRPKPTSTTRTTTSFSPSVTDISTTTSSATSTTEVPTATQKVTPNQDYTKDSTIAHTTPSSDVISLATHQDDEIATSTFNPDIALTTEQSEGTTEQWFTTTSDTNYNNLGRNPIVPHRPVIVLYDEHGNEIINQEHFEETVISGQNKKTSTQSMSEITSSTTTEMVSSTTDVSLEEFKAKSTNVPTYTTETFEINETPTTVLDHTEMNIETTISTKKPATTLETIILPENTVSITDLDESSVVSSSEEKDDRSTITTLITEYSTFNSNDFTQSGSSTDAFSSTADRVTSIPIRKPPQKPFLPSIPQEKTPVQTIKKPSKTTFAEQPSTESIQDSTTTETTKENFEFTTYYSVADSNKANIKTTIVTIDNHRPPIHDPDSSNPIVTFNPVYKPVTGLEVTEETVTNSLNAFYLAY
ncbi:serine proteinase stubble [Caerostris extrusa]|uniref:Serine proteinase stubble n=1 Tax=Caerostris extrusa TaxID=172846 RepID=A0AAV4YDP3_CAEEX|nr:serine proteinase stubble [Caerostris extrusa]